jgi:hypothetical protein
MTFAPMPFVVPSSRKFAPCAADGSERRVGGARLDPGHAPVQLRCGAASGVMTKAWAAWLQVISLPVPVEV